MECSRSSSQFRCRNLHRRISPISEGALARSTWLVAPKPWQRASQFDSVSPDIIHMLFNSASFLLFLPVVLAGYWLWSGNFGRKLILVIASCFFYAAWDWRFLGLLGFVVVTTFAASRLILYLKGRGARVQSLGILCIGIVVQLLLLEFFRYFTL